MTIERARNSEWQREWEDSTGGLHNIGPRIEEWEGAYGSCEQCEVKLFLKETEMFEEI